MLKVLELYMEEPAYFLELMWEHIYISLIAISIAAFLGMTIGILITYNERAASIVLAVINFAYTIPSISMFGLLIAWTGIGIKTALIVITVYSLLPITRNVYVGIKEVEDDIVEAAKAMGSTKLQILFKVQLPVALPVIIAGFRTMVVMVIAMTSLAAFIGAGGLGTAIWKGITTNNLYYTASGSLLVALVAIITDSLLGLLKKRITKHVFGK